MIHITPKNRPNNLKLMNTCHIKRSKLSVIFFALLFFGSSSTGPFTSGVVAAEQTSQITKVQATSIVDGVATLSPVRQTKHYFDQIITHIDSTLLEKHKVFKTDNSQLVQFVDYNILSVWNVELTLKQLIGSKHWKTLEPTEINSLKDRFNLTLHRYVREGMGFYDGQRVKLVSVKLNSKNTRGLVTVRLEPVYLPSFNVSFKIANKDNQWLLYDVMVEGISYVKMKKSEFRQIISQQGVDGLLAYLDLKNGKSSNGGQGTGNEQSQ